MTRALQCARAYGVTVEFADLGSWGSVELRSEYDPRGPVIRINNRLTMREELVALCIYHELYHHREALGEITRLACRRDRETAADAFARARSARG